eukprot:scaffold6137_cov147-Isochrysis_galbana.AAC.3
MLVVAAWRWRWDARVSAARSACCPYVVYAAVWDGWALVHYLFRPWVRGRGSKIEGGPRCARVRVGWPVGRCVGYLICIWRAAPRLRSGLCFEGNGSSAFRRTRETSSRLFCSGGVPQADVLVCPEAVCSVTPRVSRGRWWPR